jgi:hypothetical protein
MSRINKSKIISEKLKYLSITELPKHITVESISVDIDTITNKETGEEEIESYMVLVKLKTFCEPEISSVSSRMVQTNNYILSFLKKYKLDVNFKFNSMEIFIGFFLFQLLFRLLFILYLYYIYIIFILYLFN